MENLQQVLDFAKKYFTPEVLIMVILLIGTFLIFSFFIQDLFQDYFKDYQDKKKKDLRTGKASEKKTERKPKLRKRKIKSRPRLVKTPKDSEPREKKPKDSEPGKKKK